MQVVEQAGETVQDGWVGVGEGSKGQEWGEEGGKSRTRKCIMSCKYYRLCYVMIGCVVLLPGYPAWCVCTGCVVNTE